MRAQPSFVRFLKIIGEENKLKKKTIGAALGAAVLILICAVAVWFFINGKKADIGFKVKDNYVIESLNIEDSFDFYNDCYEWYKKIENDDGVYLLNTAYYDDELLDNWKGNNVYQHIPKKGFWYFAVSPSYLKTMNIDYDEKIIDDAKNGVRVFLIPDSCTEEEKTAMADYLAEDSERALSEAAPRKPEEAVQTDYYKNKEIEFDTYTPSQEYFTYPSEQNLPLTEKAPIIFICTANNMTYFESESLFATDVNSYIKFENEETVKKYTDDDFVKTHDVKFCRLSEIYKRSQLSNTTDKGLYGVFS